VTDCSLLLTPIETTGFESSAPAGPPGVRKDNMNRTRKTDRDDDVLPEYDLAGAVRGKYYKRYRQGTNVVLLDPDVAAVFRDSATVNDTLRRLLALAEAKARGQRASRPRRRRPNKPVQPTSRTRRSDIRKRVAAARG
jgi:hypothetical protein